MNIVMYRNCFGMWATVYDKWGNFDHVIIGRDRAHVIEQLERNYEQARHE